MLLAQFVTPEMFKVLTTVGVAGTIGLVLVGWVIRVLVPNLLGQIREERTKAEDRERVLRQEHADREQALHTRFLAELSSQRQDFTIALSSQRAEHTNTLSAQRADFTATLAEYRSGFTDSLSRLAGELRNLAAVTAHLQQLTPEQGTQIERKGKHESPRG